MQALMQNEATKSGQNIKGIWGHAWAGERDKGAGVC